MTEREKYITAFFKKWEGGFSNDKDDAGNYGNGCTMMGVTLTTFRKYYGKDKTCADLKKITDEQWFEIFKKGYYDKAKCGQINNDSIALLVCDMCWGSGPVTAIKKIQACLGCMVDGKVGPQTLGALNGDSPLVIFKRLWNMRYVWLNNIAKVGNNKKFLRGWLNRLNDIRYRQ